MNAIALVLIYGHLALIVQPPKLRTVFRMPAPAWMRDAFLMHGMFTSFSKFNADPVIAGLRTQQGNPSDRGQWITLRVRDHFAARHGVVFTELFATHHWDMHGRKAQRKAWATLAPLIRARHNRLHPDHAVSRIRFGSAYWPQDPAGYRARKKDLQLALWFEERRRP